MINKVFWNRIINALALIVFCFMVSTGMILKVLLPPGSGRAVRLFRGGQNQKTIDLLLGMTRHEWGTIHFYLSISFLIILCIHLFLHWSWIRATAWGSKKAPQPWLRKAVTLFILSLILSAICLPLFFPAETLTSTEYLSRHSG